ncbi:MAG: DNA ligase-associated DEXH box helicase, partial [Bdellovibrionota bacterium]
RYLLEKKCFDLSMPFSSHLSKQLRASFHDPQFILPVERSKFDTLINAQATVSYLPKPDELLVEFFKSRDGYHAFLFPFEGRSIHEGLAALISYQVSQQAPVTLTFSVNDYGLEILSPGDFNLPSFINPEALQFEDLNEALRKAINIGEMSKRKFREISQIAGLIFQGYPGQQKTVKQVQISSQLLYNVFLKYDPDNPLLIQAGREAMIDLLDGKRLGETISRLQQTPWVYREVGHPSPLAFPLIVERMSARLSSETLLQRIEGMKAQWVV